MKRMKWMSTLALAGLCMAATAQDPGELHGKVMDERGEPVPYAIVRAEQGSTISGAQTNDEGRFVLRPLVAGTYELTVQCIGYNTRVITGVRVDPGLLTRLPDVVLNDMLDVVVVERIKWEEPLIRPEDPSRMVITSTQIKNNAIRKEPVRMIASMTPGVTKAKDSDELYFRGARAGSMAYYVDGVKVTGSNPGVSSEAISRVSVYTGGLPAKYGDVTGGVVAIETKSYFELYQQHKR
ncbi:MAG: carboxypeptidase regulatory-like domain-containing protein [Flavobacteriales bacterium]|nr:TonB-dependent receptor [Flavobacteriales bacterium]MCL4282409.1 carboxypeptidase regulatory-like domain-containing protein [Flavobacteriales bacterium]